MVAIPVHSGLEAENARLREQLSVAMDLLAANSAELASARAELAQLRVQGAAANALIAQLTGRIDGLMQELAKQSDRITELLAIAQRKKSGKRAEAEEKAPEPPPPVDAAAQAAFDNRPQAPSPRGSLHDRPRTRPRPTGRKPLPRHLPVDESTVEPERCSCGCTTFDWVDEVVEEKLHAVLAHQRVRRTRRKTGRCRDCRKRTTAEAPASPFERSKVTCEWLAWAMVQKFQLLVPLHRVCRYLGLQGIAVAKSFLVSQTERAADLLAAIDGENWRELLAGGHLASDATGYKVQIPGVGLHHGHMEVYHWGDTVVFQYTAEKGGETQAAKLATFAGTLLVDAESRYNRTAENPGILEANCLAHPRRKLRDAEAVQPVLAAEGGAFLTVLFDLEAAAQEQRLEGAALREWRQSRMQPITLQLRAWMDAVEPTLLTADPVAKVIRYYRNHWSNLMRFLDDPNLPLDNSASEREFQAIAKLRLNCLFAGGTEGAHRAAILLGLAATCRRLGVDFEAYLTWVFTRRGTHRDKYGLSAAALTPAAYKHETATPTRTPGSPAT